MSDNGATSGLSQPQNFNETNGDCNLTLEAKARIEVNRQRALLIRQEKLNKRKSQESNR